MADIINFRAKAVMHRKTKASKNQGQKMGEIILFSGVRFQRDEDANHNLELNKVTNCLKSKSL